MIGLGFAALVVAIAAALGERILAAGKVGVLPGAERLAFAGGVGLGVLGMLLLGLGLASCFGKPWLAGALAGSALLAGRTGWRALGGDALQFVRSARKLAAGGGWGTRMALAALALLVLAALLGGLAPIHHGDALAGYCLVPKIYARAGGIEPPPIVHASYPMYFPLLHVLPLAWGLDSGAKGLGFLAGLLMLLATYRLGRRLFPELAPVWLLCGVAVLYGNPIVVEEAAAGLPDPGLVLYVTLALLSACLALGGVRGALALSGLFGGLAAGTKYTGLYFLAVPVAAGAVLWWRGRSRASLARAALAALVALVVASPWYLRNWIRHGNPIHPSNAGVLAGGSIAGTAEAAAPGEVVETPRELERPLWLTFLLSPWDLTMGSSYYEVHKYGFLPLYLGALPFLALCERRRGIWALALLALGYYVPWFWILRDGAYLFPWLPVASVFAARGLAAAWGWGRAGRAAVAILAGASLAGGAAAGVFHGSQYVAVVTSRESEDAFLARKTWLHAAYRRAEEILPEGSVLYVWSDYHYYHLRCAFFPGCPETRAGDSDYECQTPADFFADLRARGVTHLLVAYRMGSEGRPVLLPASGLSSWFERHMAWGLGEGLALREVDRGRAALNTSTLLGRTEDVEYVFYRLETPPGGE
ncbi:MAG: hypothetical protein HY720_06400 [Planctomycetes bacterium]|nr:hypothetical protein [Planctomycetota bacterium]